MQKAVFTAAFMAVLALTWGCKKDKDAFKPGPDDKIFAHDFAISEEGWVFGFADWHPPYEDLDWDFIGARTPLPPPLNTNERGLKLGGTNRSDDLFMFVKKKIGDLEPNTAYDVRFELEMASNAPTDGVGVGGAPNGLTIKVGATLLEPDTVYDAAQQLIVMKNIDKGNQSQAGPDVKVVGDIGVKPGQAEYALIKRDNLANPHRIQTDAKGEVWVIVGTESAFEGRSELYYNKISINFRPR